MKWIRILPTIIASIMVLGEGIVLAQPDFNRLTSATKATVDDVDVRPLAHADIYGIQAQLRQSEIDSLMDEAYRAFEARDFNRAESLLRQIIEQAPDYAYAYDNLAYFLRIQGRLYESATVLRQLAQLIPDDYAVHANLGDTLRLMGAYTEAITELELACQLQPHDAVVNTMLANVLDDAGYFERAEPVYLYALSLEPNNADIHFDYGLALYRADQLGPAAAQLRLALQLNPSHAAARGLIEHIEDSFD